MPRYAVYEIATASYLVGEYEAESEDAAKRMASDGPQNDPPSICHQCSNEVELGDWYEYQTEEI